MMDYTEFLFSKAQLEGNFGFEPKWMPDALFDFQSAMVEWSLKKGRAALFEDCGLGKTVQELTWAQGDWLGTEIQLLASGCAQP